MSEINREDAIANVALAIWHYPNELYTSLNCFENCQELAERALNCLPSAEPERKKGKWIGKEQFANSPEFYSWQCSVCGCVLEDPTLGNPYPFCPNCGSFNGGEQE